jgi:transposase
MADDIEQSIRENAQRPAKTSVDSVNVEQHSLADQIEADRYLASKQATRSKRLGLRFTKVIPPGAD